MASAEANERARIEGHRSGLGASEVTEGPLVAFGRPYRGWVLFMLAALYVCNYGDRSILSVLAQPIKRELDISDTQLGLLSGLAFAVFFAVFGYPFARLSERIGRVNVISVCALLWSGATAGCGVAANYAQLSAARFGVGIGDSGLAAPAMSLISDYYPPERRTSAISLFQVGAAIGVLLGAIGGGWIAQNYGWRNAFLFAAIPGVVLAPLFWLTVKEPPRGNWDKSARLAKVAVPSPPLRAVLKQLFSTPTFRHFVVGVVVAMFFGSPTAFVGTYYVRRFDVDLATVGMILGGLSGAAAIVGTLTTGFLSDGLGRLDKRWYALVPASAILIAAPLHVLGYLQSDWRVQVAIMVVPGVLLTMVSIPFYGVVQNLAPARMRASAAAVVFFFINLLSLGLGPLYYGALIDALTRRQFAGLGFGEYVTACGRGGGLAATPDVAAACHAALAQGTRWAIMSAALGYLWAGTHLLIASRTLAADLKAAQEFA